MALRYPNLTSEDRILQTVEALSLIWLLRRLSSFNKATVRTKCQHERICCCQSVCLHAQPHQLHLIGTTVLVLGYKYQMGIDLLTRVSPSSLQQVTVSSLSACQCWIFLLSVYYMTLYHFFLQSKDHRLGVVNCAVPRWEKCLDVVVDSYNFRQKIFWAKSVIFRLQ